MKREKMNHIHLKESPEISNEELYLQIINPIVFFNKITSSHTNTKKRFLELEKNYH